MEREERIHWLENTLFSKGGSVNVDIPIVMNGGVCDIVDKMNFYDGDGQIMLHLKIRKCEVPITDISDDSVQKMFRTICT